MRYIVVNVNGEWSELTDDGPAQVLEISDADYGDFVDGGINLDNLRAIRRWGVRPPFLSYGPITVTPD